MPIFEDELVGSNIPSNQNIPDPDLRSIDSPEPSTPGAPIDPNFILENPVETLDDLARYRKSVGFGGFQTQQSTVSEAVLEENKMFPTYQPGVDLMDIYGKQQSAGEQWFNSLVKFGATAGAIFVEGFASIPNLVDAINKQEFSELSGDEDGFEGSVDRWLKNLENTFPNYYTLQEREHPWIAKIPFAPGSANFWGDKFIKNLGFTVGAIGSALVQDAIVTGLTGGAGTAPLVAGQVGKLALKLNKLASTFSKGKVVANLGKAVNVSGKTLQGIKALETMSDFAKLRSGAQFMTTMFGASVTEAGVESREGYRQISEDLTKQYYQTNGMAPSGEEAEFIDRIATDAMNIQFGINTALLLASNSLLFGNLAKNIGKAGKPITADFSISKGPLANLKSFGLKEGSIETFERKAVKGFANKAWEKVKPVVPVMISEGVYEEGGQFATEKGTYDYFTRKYKNLNNPSNREAWDTVEESIKSVMYGLEEQFTSDEGWENMFLGALTGMSVTGVQTIVDKKNKTDKNTRTDKVINMLNEHALSGIFKQQYEDTATSAAIVEEMKKAAKAGDSFKYSNLQHDNFFNFVNARSKVGAHEVTIQQLELLKELEKEQFENTFGVKLDEQSRKTVNSYVDQLTEEANTINTVIEKLDKVYVNPFKWTTSPETKEQQADNENHLSFENWKKEVAYLNSKITYFDSLKEDANNAISEIAPALNGKILADLMNRKSLKITSQEYEEEAATLEASIGFSMDARSRSKVRQQIKKYKTLAGQASLLANNMQLSEDKQKEYFKSLLDFENSGRDIDNISYMSDIDANELLKKGVDIARANDVKDSISDILTNLTSEAGFKEYLESEKDVQTQVKPEKKDEVNYTNEKGTAEPIEIGREYQKKSGKPLNYKKLPDGTYEVPKPDGTKVNTKTEAQAKKELEDTNDTLANMGNVTILAILTNGAVKVEDNAGNIYDIDPSRLKGYEKIETVDEFIEQNQQEIEDIETEGGLNSSTILTRHSTSGFEDEGGARKHYQWLFLSTSVKSEDDNNVEDTSPHITRSRILFNKMRTLSNRKNFKTIIVNSNHVQKLGLTGIIEQSYKGVVPENVNDIDEGWMASVFIVEQENKEGEFERWFIDENGTPISKVGEQVDLNKVVYQTMPNTHLHYKKTGAGKGRPKYRENQKAEAEYAQKGYRAFRENYFAEKDGDPIVHPFRLSRGFPIVTDENARNSIVHLVPESEIATNEELISIPTSGKFDFQGQILSVAPGVPILNYGDLAEYLQNSEFNDKEATLLYEVLSSIVNKVQESLKKKVKPSLKLEEWEFIQHVLYTKSKGATEANQVRMNLLQRRLQIGKVNFSFDTFNESKDRIIAELMETYSSVNNKTLVKEFHKPFTEFYLDKDNELAKKEWTNYQTYLLSPKDTDNKSPRKSRIPLTTNINVPTKGVPYTHKQKYAIIDSVQLPIIERTKPPKPLGTSSKNIKVGDHVYDLNNTTVNTYSFASGDVLFIALEKDGVVDVTIIDDDVTLETIKNITNKTGGLEAIYAAHEQIFGEQPTVLEKESDPKDVILKVQEALIKSNIENALGTQVKAEDVTTESVNFVLDGTTENTFPLSDGKNVLVFTASLDKSGKVDIDWVSNKETGLAFKSLQENPKVQASKPGFVKAGLIPENATELDVAMINAYLNVSTAIKKPLAGEESEDNTSEEPKPKNTKKNTTQKKPRNFRIKSEKDALDRMSPEDLEIFKTWASKKLPQIPWQALSNMIRVNSTLRAWGVFEDGVAKFVEGGLRGTEYHEIFEGVWAGLLTEEEKRDILDEFRNSGEEFTDRVSGKVYSKSDPSVSNQIIKERIADDFADWRLKKLAPKNIGVRIMDFFKRVLQFFRIIKKNTSLKEDLFNQIEAGKLKERTLQLKPSIPNDIATLTEFEGTVIEYVDHIGFATDGREIGARNLNKGEKILVNLNAMKEKFNNKTWTNPITSEALPEDTFKTFEEFMMFMFLHEKAHEYIFRKENETKGQYETRINNEARRRLDEDFLVPQFREEGFLETSNIEGVTETEAREYVEDMIGLAAGILFNENDKSTLFSLVPITKQRLFDAILEYYHLDQYPEVVWQQLIQRATEKLRTLNIVFDENDQVSINEEGVNNKEYAESPFELDTKSSSPGALKILLATLYETEQSKEPNLHSIEGLETVQSSIDGYKLIPYGRVFGILIDTLSNTNDRNLFMQKLSDLADRDNNFVRLYERLGGTYQRKSGRNKSFVKWEEFDDYDWRLFNQFFQTFSKAFPEAIVQYNNNGEVYSASINKASTGAQVRRTWIDNMKLLANDKESLVFYDQTKRIYRVKPLTSTVKEHTKGGYLVTTPFGKMKVIKEKKDAEIFAKNESINLTSYAKIVEFLNHLGIEFRESDIKKLDANEKKKFNDAVGRLHKYLGQNNEIYSLSGKTLAVNKPFLDLADLYIAVNGLAKESTHYGIDGERRNNYSLDNASTIFENDFNESGNITELKKLRPELNDIYSKHSLLLTPGTQYSNKQGTFKRAIRIKYIQGTRDLGEQKATTTNKLVLSNRHIQEINQNLDGNYYILIPADSSTEWMINLGNNFSFTEMSRNKKWNKVTDVFVGYLKDEIALALDYKNREYLKNVKDRAKELRMFKDILKPYLVKAQREGDPEGIEDMLKRGASLKQFDSFIEKNITAIEESVIDVIRTENYNLRTTLLDNGKLIQKDEFTYSFPELDSNFASDENLDRFNLSDKELQDLLDFLSVNYAVNNIELHKVLFGDPFLFADKEGVTEAMKRVKSFLSPAKKMADFAPFNSYLNRTKNKVGDDIQLTDKDFGYHNYKSYANTAVVNDVNIAGSLSNVLEQYGNTNMTDGFSWISPSTYREVLQKNGQWGDEAEDFYQWQMAYTRKSLADKGKWSYRNKALEAHDNKLINNSKSPEYYLKVLKPIVRGTKNNRNQIDLALDKFAQMPVFYSMVEGTTMEDFFIKIFEEKVDYVVVNSARKIGIESSHDLYIQEGDDKGKFNPEAFAKNTLTQIPWKYYGIQVETAHDGAKYQTRGSQITKMVSINLFSNGEAIGATPERKAEIQKLYDEYIDTINMMHDNAYRTLLRRLGIKDNNDGSFVLEENGKKVSDALVYEMLRRDVSENVKATVKLDKNQQFKIPFEASPSYVQIKDIMYSMINKSLLSPKMSGGSHVQVSSVMFEQATKGRSLMMKEKGGGWIKITKKYYKTLSKIEKKKVLLGDDTLKFYEDADDKRYCEIMLPHWFKEELSGLYKTDKELLEALEKDPKLKKVLRGIGFRIPTQLASSIEAFKVVGFLPKYMGSTVVVPAEITTKAGSDFDIDKLNLYLKSLYLDENGKIQMPELLDTEEETKEVFRNTFNKKLEKKTKELNKKIEKLEEETAQQIANAEARLSGDSKYIASILQDIYDDTDLNNEAFYAKLNKLTDKEKQAELREKWVDELYKKAIENKHYEALEALITLPENFEHLISPVDDGGYKATAQKIRKLKGIKKPKNVLISRNYITNKRNSFALAKRWIGVAATNITGLSNRQKTTVYFDRTRIDKLTDYYKKWMGDGNIQLPHNKVKIDGVEYLSISGITTADLQDNPYLRYLSNRFSGFATATVDVANDDYILDVYSSDLIISTAMFLEAAGAGETGRMFLAQPIIQRYLRKLDNANLTNIFSSDNVEDVLAEYTLPSSFDLSNYKIDLSKLEENIELYAKNPDVSSDAMLAYNEQQGYILAEFLKYAKLGRDMFMLNQATNYDTSKIRNGEEYIRKDILTQLAEEENLFSSAQNILDATFIGKQKQLVGNAINMLSSVFKLDEPRYKSITNKVLQKYAERAYISDDDFSAIIQNIKIDYLDYLIQTNLNITEDIQSLLLDKENSIAIRLQKARLKYDNLQIFKHLDHVISDQDGGPQTIKLNRSESDAFDDNYYIGLMRELRDFNTEETNKLYEDIIKVSILQGTKRNTFSIKHIIPVEDYAAVVKPIVENTNPIEATDVFSKGMFERANHNNTVIMPVYTPRFRNVSDQGSEQHITEDPVTKEDIFLYEPNLPKGAVLFPFIQSLGLKRKDRRVLVLNERYNFRHVDNEFLKIPRTLKVNNKYKSDATEYVDITTGKSITYTKYKQAIEKGDRSLYSYLGYQKVKNPDGSFLTVTDKNGETLHIYKQIDLLGENKMLTEYYSHFRPSAINNNTVKVKGGELADSDIVSYYDGKSKDIAPSKEQYAFLEMTVDHVNKIKAGIKTITNRKTFIDNGTYKLKGGQYVSLKLISTAKVLEVMGGKKVVQFNKEGMRMSLDEYAQKEGFKDWAEFADPKRDKNFSLNFINNGQVRYVYDVVPVKLSAEEAAEAREVHKNVKEVKKEEPQIKEEPTTEETQTEEISEETYYDKLTPEQEKQVPKGYKIFVKDGTYDVVDYKFGDGVISEYASSFEEALDAIAKYEESKKVQEDFKDDFLEAAEKIQKEIEAREGKTIDEKTPKSTFTYLGKTINTEFPLSPDQTKALEEMIDFMNDPTKPRHVLQGAAGTGKTSLIGYLQKYMNKQNLYLAPTHAATVELAFGTMKTGNRKLPITVASSMAFDKRNQKWGLSRKARERIGLGNTIVVDETSMLNTKDYVKLKDLAKDFKIIFLGDKKQIPEVRQGGKGQPKNISVAFTENPISNLNKIHRTSNEDIKGVLQKVRDSVSFQLYKTNNTDNLKFFKSDVKFKGTLQEFVTKYPEDTDYIGYTNKSVSAMNKTIREDIFNRYGELQKGDIIMGYLGYSTKQIELGQLANSVSYTIDEVKKETNSALGLTGYKIKMTSARLEELR